MRFLATLFTVYGIISLVIGAIPMFVFITKKRIPLAVLSPIACFVSLFIYTNIVPPAIVGTILFVIAMIIPASTKDEAEARNVMKEIEAQDKANELNKTSDPLSGTPEGKWICRHCNELNPNAVTKCIHCGEKK